MDDEPNYTRTNAKKARVSLDSPSSGSGKQGGVGAASSSTTTTTTTTGAPSTAFCPPPRAPPDPRRYLALWKEAFHRNTNSSSNNSDAGAPSPSPLLSTILDELELAEHNHKTWERIHALQQTIDDCEQEIFELRKEIDIRTCLPRLLDDDPETVDEYWRDMLPTKMKSDATFAWALVRTANHPSVRAARRAAEADYLCADDVNDPYWEISALPLPFQKMLWSNRGRCALRKDRQLLLASLDNGLDRSVRISWTKKITNDREILIKIFETCPWCLSGSSVPEPILKDAELIRAFARSESLRRYRESLAWSEGNHVVCRFNVREDPALLAELVRQYVDTKHSDKWAGNIVNRHLKLLEQSPNDYLRLAVAVAKEVAHVPWKEYNQHCPLRYSTLPTTLQSNREFVLAFIPVDTTVTSKVPRELRDDEELWLSSAQSTPRYGSMRVPAPVPGFPSKLFYLLRLEDAKGRYVNTPRNHFIPDAAMKDRDIALTYGGLLSFKVESWWDSRIPETYKNDRDFWIELVEHHRCHVRAWPWVPEPFKADPAVVWAWARHAKEMEASWLVSRDPPELLASLMLDRQVLLNCLPPVWSDNFYMNREENREMLWSKIDPTMLDYSLWLNVLPRCEYDCFDDLLPVEIKNDPAIVRARLQSTKTDIDWFVDLYCCTLPVDVQLQHVDFLLEMIQGMDEEEFFESRLFRILKVEVLRSPEVTLALLSKGWCTSHRRFTEAVTLAPWRNDPDFLMLVAERQLLPALRGCYPKMVLTNKDFVLRAVQVDPRHWNELDYADSRKSLKYDFDVLVSLLGSTPDAVLSRIPLVDSDLLSRSEFPFDEVVPFAREVRRRLTLYASIETVMMGTRSRRTSTQMTSSLSPLVLLDQDRYTKGAFRSQLTALLGAPPCDDGTVASLRRVSNSLTRYGF